MRGYALAPLTVLLVAASAARADDASVAAIEAVTGGWSGAGLTLYGSDASRRLVGLKSPGSWPPVVGVGVDGELHFRPNHTDTVAFAWRYAGLHFASSVQGQSSEGTSGESPVWITNGPLNVVEMDIPLASGFAIDFYAAPSFRMSFGVNWGWAYAWTAAAMTSAAGASSGGMHTDSIYVRADVDLCVRLGTYGRLDADTHLTSWGCLTAQPDVYEFGWMSGSVVGLKVEL